MSNGKCEKSNEQEMVSLHLIIAITTELLPRKLLAVKSLLAKSVDPRKILMMVSFSMYSSFLILSITSRLIGVQIAEFRSVVNEGSSVQ